MATYSVDAVETFGPGLQDLYIANLRGDHFSRVRTAFHGHPLYHQR